MLGRNGQVIVIIIIVVCLFAIFLQLPTSKVVSLKDIDMLCPSYLPMRVNILKDELINSGFTLHSHSTTSAVYWAQGIQYKVLTYQFNGLIADGIVVEANPSFYNNPFCDKLPIGKHINGLNIPKEAVYSSDALNLGLKQISWTIKGKGSFVMVILRFDTNDICSMARFSWIKGDPDK
jgi:hypothetical protein